MSIVLLELEIAFLSRLGISDWCGHQACDPNPNPNPKLRVEVTIEREPVPRIRVWNDGQGLPIVLHGEHNVYIPEMLFGQLLTSSNFDDKEAKTTGGRNGYGAKLANLFSTRFVVETADKTRQLHYQQEWGANMSRRDEPQIAAWRGKKEFTCVTFEPDLARFGLTQLAADWQVLAPPVQLAAPEEEVVDKEDEADREDGEEASALPAAPMLDALLNLPLRSLTREKAEALQRDQAAKHAEWERMKATTPEQLWLHDLDHLESVLREHEAEWAATTAAASQPPTRKRGRAAGGATQSTRAAKKLTKGTNV
eukprot:gene9684-10709_t